MSRIWHKLKWWVECCLVCIVGFIGICIINKYFDDDMDNN